MQTSDLKVNCAKLTEKSRDLGNILCFAQNANIWMLQALWEEKSTGAKWVKVNWCYYPSDLPVETGQPALADDNEVSLNCAQ